MKVGERYGQYIINSSIGFSDVFSWSRWFNLECLIERGYDPPEIVVDRAHKLGLEVFASIRMNDCHDAYTEMEDSAIKKNHPEWLIGEANRRYRRKTTGGGCVKRLITRCLMYAGI